MVCDYGFEVVFMCVDYLFGIDWFVEVVVVFGWCDDIVVVNV